MDPVTPAGIASIALSVAGTAWRVGESLYTFVQDTRNIEATVQNFASETHALSTACRVIGVRLEAIVKEHDHQFSASPNDNLWTCLHSEVIACRITISQLEEAVKCAEATTSKSKAFFGKAVRQTKLNWKGKDITNIRSRIASHTSSLQLMLQAVNTEMTYLVPNRVDQGLRAQIAELIARQAEINRLQTDEDESKSNDELLRVTTNVITRAESLYTASIAGGSVIGELDDLGKGHVVKRMQDVEALEDEPRKGSSRNDALHSFDERWESRSTSTIKGEDGETTSNTQSDDEDDFLIDAAKEALEVGRKAFVARDFARTAASLEEALQILNELPLKRRAFHDSAELRYMLGISSFYLHQPEKAEKALLYVVEAGFQTEDPTNSMALQICDASHHLAQVYIRQNKMEAARLHSNNAFNGRRQALGKAAQETYESLALLSRILELKNSSSRGRIYFNMVPEDQRVTLYRWLSSLYPDDAKANWQFNDIRSLVAKMATASETLFFELKKLITLQFEQEKDRWTLEGRVVALRSELYLEKIEYEMRRLDHPRIVCAAQECVEYVNDYKVYKSICQDPCYLENVEVDTMACPELLQTEAFGFGSSKTCLHCGHSWKVHLHITWEPKEVVVKVVDDRVQKDLNTVMSALQKASVGLKARDDHIV